MDLSKLDTVKQASEGFELQLQDPGTNKNLGIFITVLGHDSEEYTKLQSKQNKRRTARMFSAGRFKPGAISDEEIKQDTIELLAECTKAWRDEGEKLPESIKVGVAVMECTRENAIKLYTEYPWVKEQVDAAVVDRANFIKS